MVAIAVAAPAYAASRVLAPTVDAAGASCRMPRDPARTTSTSRPCCIRPPGNGTGNARSPRATIDSVNVAALPADTTLTNGEGNVILVVNR